MVFSKKEADRFPAPDEVTKILRAANIR